MAAMAITNIAVAIVVLTLAAGSIVEGFVPSSTAPDFRGGLQMTVEAPPAQLPRAKLEAAAVNAKQWGTAAAGTQAPPPAQLELPRARLIARAVNEKQWGVRRSVDAANTPTSAGGTAPDPREFLRTLTSSRSTRDDKTQLLEAARQLRVQGDAVYFAFLDALLAEVDSVRGNVWAMRRWPVALPSYRVKLGCLSRLLDELAKEGVDENVRREGVRSRTLALVLRQLGETTGVRALEAEAKRAKKEVTMADMLARTPADLETPRFSVVAEKGAWEVREYDDFSVCSFDMAASPEKAGFGAFNALAGYIFGGNKEQVKMKMTTPVINHGASSKMSFIMPSNYWAPEAAGSAPTPAQDSGVRVETKGGGMIAASQQVAALWFGGFASKEVVAVRKAALKAALAADPDWEALDAGADPLLLQYNDPFQPPWKRRNEVVMAIRRVGVASRPVQGNGGVAVEEDKEEAAAVVDYFAKLSELRDTSTKTLERRLG